MPKTLNVLKVPVCFFSKLIFFNEFVLFLMDIFVIYYKDQHVICVTSDKKQADTLCLKDYVTCKIMKNGQVYKFYTDPSDDWDYYTEAGDVSL